MPPRRSTRASSSSRLFDNSSEAGGPLDSMPTQSVHAIGGRGMSPGPAKYSSAYGSPPTILPTRQNVARQRYNFSSALSHVVDAVEQDNANDARERAAAREAEQRQQSEARTSLQPAQQPARSTSRPIDETTESIELVTERTDNVEPSSPDQNPQSHEASADPQPTHPAPDEGPAAPNFDEEERVFAETQIFTPILPSRTSGVVSKTSNILHSILNSARRVSSTIREDPDDEAIRSAYPQFHFIRPRPDNQPPETVDTPSNPSRRTTRSTAAARAKSKTAEPTAAATTTTTTTSAAHARGAAVKATKARISTPGPGLRSRRSFFRLSRDSAPDELAGDGDDTGTASARSLLGRKRTTRTKTRITPQEPQQSDGQQPPEQETTRTSSEEAHGKITAASVSSTNKANAMASSPWGYLWSMSEVIKAFSTAITLVVLAAIAVRVFVISTSPSELYEGYRVDNRLHWYGSDWRSNLRQLVPFALVHPLGAISDEEFARMNGLILSHANEVAQMKHADRLHASALERISHVLPSVVHMELDRQGRPVIAQEFWHALKDHIETDKDIFTLVSDRDGVLTISDLQWAALQRRLQASGLLPEPDAKALSVTDVEGIAETTMAKSWESWLQRNQNKIKSLLGVVPEPSSPVDYGDVVDRLTDDQVSRLARQMARSAGAAEVLVPRHEFLQMLQNAFVEHRLDIRGEMDALEARVVEMARAAASAVSAIRSSPAETSPSVPTGAVGGLTKREIATMVDQLVRKGISDAQLEALARGKIKAHWHTDLINRVNFFSLNMGAAINRHFTSFPFEPVKPPFWKLYAGGGGAGRGGAAGVGGADPRPLPGSQRSSVIFQQWEQDGDCWCAMPKQEGTERPVDVAVKLALPIVPQYLVVEHISPSATLDPGAMPKDLEVWVQITDYAQQRSLQDWSLSQFPHTAVDHPLYGWGFVKAGEFTLEGGMLGRGAGDKNADGGNMGIAGSTGSGRAQVFRLSPDLEALDAVTDHIIVRAVSNYGAEDHTCFYRVRMYGDLRPDVIA